jgi:hypothetical protein
MVKKAPPKKPAHKKQSMALTKQQQHGGFIQFLPMIASAVLPSLIEGASKLFSGKGVMKKTKGRY